MSITLRDILVLLLAIGLIALLAERYIPTLWTRIKVLFASVANATVLRLLLFLAAGLLLGIGYKAYRDNGTIFKLQSELREDGQQLDENNQTILEGAAALKACQAKLVPAPTVKAPAKHHWVFEPRKPAKRAPADPYDH
jgi:hypothetical protein